ncbi:LCP family protein [Actinoallomurus purpureus]|uniref:LCP family protein n=1 Tax=Actinoallomurus purpureus TaxID=478114 RepID=UPI002093C699|nr:LCP family protein [Actinoallomurus purpureus]MCO6006802.1 LCP family protein [Actinoallomurus purpureus]
MAWGQAGGHRPNPVAGLWRALGLTAASAVVWGVAHVAAGRRASGFTLMGILGLLIAGAATAVLGFQEKLKQIAVQGVWLNVITVGILVLALAWASIVIRSYQVVRPPGLPTAMRVASTTLVVVMSLLICTPFVYAANTTYVLKDTLSKIFPGDDHSGQQVDAANPWKNMPRVNVLLLGGDGGKDRKGIRTDSMTVASIDTKTGTSVLISLPRSLQKFQLPAGPLRKKWPYGYTGDALDPMHPGSEGLLNELYLQGQQHAELAPGYKKGRGGPHVIESVIEYLTGLKINYYVLVNLGGFKDIVNAVGGVTVNITEKKPIPIGGEIVNGRQVKPPTGYLPTGKHHLNGEKALWYGRSRDGDNDFHRMDRQKCLLKDIADQANPEQVVTHFQKLAKAAQNTVATNIPSALLPALIKLSSTVKHGADIQSLPFNPDKIPGFEPYEPNVRLMRNVVAKAIANSGHPATPTRTPSATPKKHKKKTPTAGTSATPGATASNGSVSLKNVCG